MTKIILAFYFGFCLGAIVQRWDAQYGYETGLKHGRAVKEFFIGEASKIEENKELRAKLAKFERKREAKAEAEK